MESFFTNLDGIYDLCETALNQNDLNNLWAKQFLEIAAYPPNDAKFKDNPLTQMAKLFCNNELKLPVLFYEKLFDAVVETINKRRWGDGIEKPDKGVLAVSTGLGDFSVIEQLGDEIDTLDHDDPVEGEYSLISVSKGAHVYYCSDSGDTCFIITNIGPMMMIGQMSDSFKKEIGL